MLVNIYSREMKLYIFDIIVACNSPQNLMHFFNMYVDLFFFAFVYCFFFSWKVYGLFETVQFSMVLNFLQIMKNSISPFWPIKMDAIKMQAAENEDDLLLMNFCFYPTKKKSG